MTGKSYSSLIGKFLKGFETQLFNLWLHHLIKGHWTETGRTTVSCISHVSGTKHEMLQLITKVFTLLFYQIIDVTTHHTERLCGYLYPFTWTTNTNEVLIKFVSDNYLEEPGFAASYTTIPKLTKTTGKWLYLTYLTMWIITLI